MKRPAGCVLSSLPSALSYVPAATFARTVSSRPSMPRSVCRPRLPSRAVSTGRRCPRTQDASAARRWPTMAERAPRPGTKRRAGTPASLGARPSSAHTPRAPASASGAAADPVEPFLRSAAGATGPARRPPPSAPLPRRKRARRAVTPARIVSTGRCAARAPGGLTATRGCGKSLPVRTVPSASGDRAGT